MACPHGHYGSGTDHHIDNLLGSQKIERLRILQGFYRDNECDNQIKID